MEQQRPNGYNHLGFSYFFKTMVETSCSEEDTVQRISADCQHIWIPRAQIVTDNEISMVLMPDIITSILWVVT